MQSIIEEENEIKLYQYTQKYRSLNFKDIVGNRQIVDAIQKQAKEGKIRQTYLFEGQSGVGKTTLARTFGKAIDCTKLNKDGEPCNKCPVCLSVNNNTFQEGVYEINAAHIDTKKVDEIIENSRFSHFTANRKVFIINEIQALFSSPQAQRKMLSLMEDVNPNSVFIFTTMEPEKLDLSLFSRGSRFHFNTPSHEELLEYLLSILEKEYEGDLEEFSDAQTEVLTAIIDSSGGSIRDMVNNLETIIEMNEWDINNLPQIGIISSRTVLEICFNICNRDFNFLYNLNINSALFKRIFDLFCKALQVNVLNGKANKYLLSEVGKLANQDKSKLLGICDVLASNNNFYDVNVMSYNLIKAGEVGLMGSPTSIPTEKETEKEKEKEEPEGKSNSRVIRRRK